MIKAPKIKGPFFYHYFEIMETNYFLLCPPLIFFPLLGAQVWLLCPEEHENVKNEIKKINTTFRFIMM